VTTRLCRAEEIAEGSAKGIDGAAPGEKGLILVRRGGRLRAYVNACPHLGTPLNFLPDRFLDRDGRHLICTTHGAVFRIEDGLCLRGPCRNERLTAVAVDEDAGMVALRSPPGESGNPQT
jgi:nitrite reductase/ring-hydroxylating ferredoxin subunit